ncbi:MAG: hypothetical protein GXO85_14220 [Chlorobi bacterium]|nr:hypothetical protein [Chlorobiota bacterium]
MKPLVCIYCEGSDLKLSVISREKEKLCIHSIFTVELTELELGTSATEQLADFSKEDISDGLTFDSFNGGIDLTHQKANSNATDVELIAASLAEFNLNQAQFIPVVTDPNVNFHIYENSDEKNKSNLLDKIIKDILVTKGITVLKDNIDYISIDENTYLCVFIDKEISCVNLVNSVAAYNGKRYYKINSIKNAEIALANYVSKTTKFFAEDYTLVIYIGKEYSKLIFLEGQNLSHIGATLDIGTSNLNTYDVYFSKILLEMENGGIPRLDNVVLCGEDRSENLVLSFYGTFPEANVTKLKFDLFDLADLEEDDQNNISTYSVPIAAAYEYYAEEDKELKGINILPRYIIENQKFLQFGWHSFVVLPFLFIATFLFTYLILSNNMNMVNLDKEIQRMKELEIQNQEIIAKIEPLESRIANFDNTQAILDSAMSGTEVWGKTLEKVANFVERRRNFWVSNIETKNLEDLTLRGYSLSRTVLTEFAEYNNSSILQNVLYEPLREKNAFAYIMNFKLQKNEQ